MAEQAPCLVGAHWLLRRDCRAWGPGRTAHPPAGSPRLPVAPHHCGDRRWHRACGPHGHRPRQGAALFVGRAGGEDWTLVVAPAITAGVMIAPTQSLAANTESKVTASPPAQETHCILNK